MLNTQSNNNIDTNSAPDTVNQYGDRSLYANNIENLTLNYNSNPDSPKRDENGKPYTPLNSTRYDKINRIIYLGNEEIQLPVELTPLPLISEYDMPYINALCEVYAEKLEQEVTPDSLATLPDRYKKNFSEQRKAFYSAESVQRSVREVFADGEEQFNLLKDDAYEGISPIYFDDTYATGYDRLIAVLSKITNTTLSVSTLTNIIGLIGNLEKKGICHILVNDDRIKSWVNIDE